jgi:hypothetical protein
MHHSLLPKDPVEAWAYLAGGVAILVMIAGWRRFLFLGCLMVGAAIVLQVIVAGHVILHALGALF